MELLSVQVHLRFSGKNSKSSLNAAALMLGWQCTKSTKPQHTILAALPL